MLKHRASAAYRIAFLYSAVFALAIAALGTAVFFAADANFRRDQDARLCAESLVLANLYNARGLEALRQALASRRNDITVEAFGYALYDLDGRRIAGALQAPRPAPGTQDIQFFDPGEGIDPARANSMLVKDGRLLTVALDQDRLANIDRTILTLFGTALAGVVLLGVAGALMLGTYLQRRLASISATSSAIMAGDFTRRAAIGPRGDEFDTAAASLNAMLDRIAALLDNLRQVSSDVAHDLRTPLARLRGKLEQAREAQDLAALDAALTDLDEILALFAAILRISEVEAGAIERFFELLTIEPLLFGICETCRPAVEDGGRTLLCRIDQDFTVRGDRQLLTQAVINLIDNAQLYTPIGTSITVSADMRGTTAQITVADNGPGVAAEDREHIVRRFVRLEASRSTPGNGLGLSLVAAIAASHGGSVTIEDNAPGLRVSLLLPTGGERVGKIQ